MLAFATLRDAMAGRRCDVEIDRAVIIDDGGGGGGGGGLVEAPR